MNLIMAGLYTTRYKVIKPILLSGMLVAMFSCSKNSGSLHGNSIMVRPVFQDTSFYHYDGYKINEQLVLYDKYNAHVKDYLSKNLADLTSFKPDITPNRVVDLFQGKKKHKYFRVKVVPLSEFGYLQTVNGDIIFYAVMGKNGFIDLTNNFGYH